MKIYRLENSKGEGVYGRGYGYKCNREMMHGADHQDYIHPSPSEDSLLQNWWNGDKLRGKNLHNWLYKDEGRMKWQCAFESLEQLEHWFPRDGLELMQNLNARAKDDMALVVYNLPHHKVKKGEHQAVYHKDHVVLVERIELSDLIERIKA